MTPLAHMRLIYLPLFLLGFYLVARILIPGPLGIVIGLVATAIGLMWAALTIRRSRTRGEDQ